MDSPAWNYFMKDDTGLKAICNICKASIGCKGSSTSGLLRHLKNIHRELVPQKRKADEDMADQPSQRKKVKQQTLDRAFMSAKRSSLAEILARLAAEDGISIRAITRSKFIRNSISAQGYTPPKCEKTVMKLIIEYHHAIVAEVKKEIADKVSNGERFSITLDEWTSTRNRRYMNVNVHDKAGMMNNLGLIRVPNSCPAEKAVSLIEGRLEDFGLSFSSHIVSSTTDGASVMLKFGRISPAEHQLCFNHAIHLAVVDTLYKSSATTENDIEEMSDCDDDDEMDTDDDDSQSSLPVERDDLKALLKKLRETVKIFRKSPVRNNTLQKYVLVQEGKELELLHDCPTRWNSLEKMLARYLLLRDCVTKALIDLKMSSKFQLEEDHVKLQELLDALAPIRICVDGLSRRDTNLLK